MSLMMIVNISYCQYPKTKVINGEQIVMVTKKQADDINTTFLRFTTIIDSQKTELSKPPKIDTVVVVKDDTAVSYWKTFYEAKVKECYDINRGLSDWFEQVNKTAMFFDTCSYKELKKRYRELEKIRKTRYD